MAIVINGSGTVTGISVGGLPDDIIDAGTLADNAVGLAQMAGRTDGNIITYDTSDNPAVVATGSDGQILTSAGADAVPAFEAAAAGGITETDQWVLTVALALGTSDTFATANWARQNDSHINSTGFGLLGTGMSESSGVFSFPSTGYWMVDFNAMLGGTVDCKEFAIELWATTNNSDYTTAAQAITHIKRTYTSGYTTYVAASCKLIFDVTSTANCKLKVSGFSTLASSTEIFNNNTYLTFIKLGDT